jgi:TPR repeat protein/transglutaminase-like putative cysteine protease
MPLLVTLLLSLLMTGLAAPELESAASANDSTHWIDPGWRRTMARHTITFDEKGMKTDVVEYEIQVLDEKGVEAIAQQTVDYNSYFDDVSVDLFSTIKSDGRVISGDERAIKDQPYSSDTSSPYFDERRVKIIAFSDVAPGDKVRARLTYSSRRPEFPGQFAGYWSMPPNQPPEAFELTIDGPASKPLEITTLGVEHTQERVGDRIIHRVTFRQDTPRALVSEADWFDGARRFEASTFKDYAAFAAAMNARNAPMAVPDETLTRLSTEIVGDAATTRAKVERLHNWVARNIRYVGIGFEDGGWTSQPAPAILASRYGDCKAHATILKALLAAQGIEANFVAVNVEERYTLTKVATPNFDHAIVYVPELDLYLDPTASLVAIGTLPARLYGKPVLNIDKGVISSIPVERAEDFILQADTEYTLRPDGTRKAISILSGTKIGASLGRAIAAHLETKDRAQLATQKLVSADLVGSGDYIFPNPRELSDTFTMTAPFEITKITNLSEPARIRMLPLTDQRPSLSWLSSHDAADKDFQCLSLTYRGLASLTLPKGSYFNEKPAASSYDRSFSGDTAYGPVTGRARVTRTATLDGATVRSETFVELDFSAPICPKSFSNEIRVALARFDEFERYPIGITPRPVTHVVDIESGYEEGLAAYRSRNYALALIKWKPVADQGNSSAQVYLGDMYRDGRGVAQDYDEASRWYRKAAEQGDALGQSNLAYLFKRGLGLPQDYKQAFEWYSKAATQGNSYAQYNLGMLYAEGRGTPQDYGQAIAWYTKSADQEYLGAQTKLGLMYDIGQGIARNYETAAQWYRKAAEKGDAWAQLDLGLLYAHGRGLPLDYKLAAEWFRKSADQGNASAQYNLGWMYENGLYFPKDDREAIEWYTKSAALGHAEAGSRLDALQGGGFWSRLFGGWRTATQ